MKGVVSILFLVAGAAACGNDTGSNVDAGPAGAPTLAAIKDDIFVKSCVLSTCHGGAVPQAKLDLTKNLCGALVQHKSCLYPDKKLVVPGDPAASFLLDKLKGNALSSVAPQADCGATNELMPFGQPKLPDEKIAQVEEWIRMGADCGTGMPGDAGIDAPIDSSPTAPEEVAEITAASTTLVAGEKTRVTVTLAGPAPVGNQRIDLSVSNGSVLGVPSAVSMPAGNTSITFDVQAKRPARPVTLTAASGGASKSLAISVTGLLLAEVFTSTIDVDSELQWIKIRNQSGVAINLEDYSLGAGRAGYTSTKVQFAKNKIIPAGGCFLIGGPRSAPENGNPTLAQTFDFAPDMVWGPITGGQASAYGLFDIPLTDITSSSLPIDAVLCGTNNAAGVLGPDGQPAPLSCPDIAVGQSVERTSVSAWVVKPAPTPGACTVISQ